VNYYRYIELCNAGPKITDEDKKRLASFVPTPTKMARAVRFACAQMLAGRA
jgi:hypothetical protein